MAEPSPAPRRRQRGRPAAHRAAAPAGPRARPADAAQLRRPALRRDSLGRASAAGARPVRRGAAQSRRRGADPARPARPRPSRSTPPASRWSSGRCPTNGSATSCAGSSRAISPGCSAAELADVSHRRAHQRRAGHRQRSRGAADGPARVRRAAAAEPAVHPGLLGVGRTAGGDHQPEHAGAAARDLADRCDLPPPSAVRRYADALLPRRRVARGRRRPAARPRRHRGRRRAADPGRRGRDARDPRVRGRAGPHRSRRTRSLRNAPRCTSTRSARWSTSTRS